MEEVMEEGMEVMEEGMEEVTEEDLVATDWRHPSMQELVPALALSSVQSLEDHLELPLEVLREDSLVLRLVSWALDVKETFTSVKQFHHYTKELSNLSLKHFLQ
jgi:predicted subunit of tRNA(5-methylaminomethyl-2-thiouridylate) methyltransferase